MDTGLKIHSPEQRIRGLCDTESILAEGWRANARVDRRSVLVLGWNLRASGSLLSHPQLIVVLFLALAEFE